MVRRNLVVRLEMYSQRAKACLVARGRWQWYGLITRADRGSEYRNAGKTELSVRSALSATLTISAIFLTFFRRPRTGSRTRAKDLTIHHAALDRSGHSTMAPFLRRYR